MIVRAWRGWTLPSNSQSYANHFTRKVLPQLRALDGFLGASLLRQNRSSDVEFLVLTRWKSMDAIREFAGEPITRAVVEPDAAAVLLRFDETVQHYDVLVQPEMERGALR